MGQQKMNYSKKEKQGFLDILKKNEARISTSCSEFGISRQTYYTWYNDEKWFKDTVDAINEGLIEKVENALQKLIDIGSEPSIIFYLKTIGKKHGYGDNIDLNLHLDKIKFKFGNDEESSDNQADTTDSDTNE